MGRAAVIDYYTHLGLAIIILSVLPHDMRSFLHFGRIFAAACHLVLFTNCAIRVHDTCRVLKHLFATIEVS